MSIAKGKYFEELVSKRMEISGYTIVCRNYHSRYGEIDIIAKNDRDIVFVEVKARKLGAQMEAIYSITRSKIHKICITAALYLCEFPSKLQPRFDVVTITFAPDLSVLEYNHIENAFDYEVGYESDYQPF